MPSTHPVARHSNPVPPLPGTANFTRRLLRDLGADRRLDLVVPDLVLGVRGVQDRVHGVLRLEPVTHGLQAVDHPVDQPRVAQVGDRPPRLGHVRELLVRQQAVVVHGDRDRVLGAALGDPHDLGGLALLGVARTAGRQVHLESGRGPFGHEQGLDHHLGGEREQAGTALGVLEVHVALRQDSAQRGHHRDPVQELFRGDELLHGRLDRRDVGDHGLGLLQGQDRRVGRVDDGRGHGAADRGGVEGHALV